MTKKTILVIGSSVFIWKEFKGAPRKVYSLLGIMFALFVAGLACIVVAGM